MLNTLPGYFGNLSLSCKDVSRAMAALFTFFIALAPVNAQKENNTWYFGDGLGLNFNTTPPTPLTNGSLYAFEGCASVSDGLGNILFYTDGLYVYNRHHRVMDNGAGLKGDISSTQGAAIVKKPGSNNLYYIFIMHERFSTFGMVYNVVDISKNGGDGEVILKNTPLIQDFGSEKLVIVKNAYGCGFWIITHNLSTGTYYSFHLNSTGIDTVPVKSKIGFSSTTLKNPGYLKASMDGKKLASAFTNPDGLELLDFDNLTGIVSNCQTIDSGTSNRYYGVSFSPDNKYLYVSSHATKSSLYQYDVSLPTAYEIAASRELIFAGTNTYGALQTGPDGLIYLAKETATSGKYSLGVIKYPNNKGPLCGYIDTGMFINTSTSTPAYGLPNLIESTRPFNLEFELGEDTFCTGNKFEIDGAKYIDGDFLWSTGDTTKIISVSEPGLYKLTVSSLCGTYTDSVRVLVSKLPVFLGNDTVLCTGNKLEIDGAKHLDGDFLWNTGDTTKTISVSKPGLYTLTVSSPCRIYTGSVKVQVGKPFPVFLGNDTAFCGPFSHLLDARKGAQAYRWNTGDTTVTLLVDKPNIYAVAIKDTNSCETGDTIDIGQLHKPVVSLHLDTVTCRYVSLSIPKPDSAIKHQWSTGDTGLTIRVTQKGNYSVTFSSKFCSISASAIVDMLPKPIVELGPDTSICEGNPIQLNAISDGEKYLWNTQETGKAIIVANEGTYNVTVSRNNCSATDSVWVGPVCDMWYYIPTAFTPGRDAKNDVFEVAGGYVKHVDMQIFDRWGGHIYSGAGIRPQWDGSYKSEPCADGTYIYLISVTGYKRGRMVKENLSGNITLLR